MNHSPRLAMPLVPTSQAGGDILHNDAMKRVEQACHLHVKSRTTSAEPGSPTAGDIWILPASVTGTNWSGQGGRIAISENGWLRDTDGDYLEPADGMVAFVEDEDLYVIYLDGQWLAPDHHIIKASDTTRSSGTASVDPDLQLMLEAGHNYLIRGQLFTTGDAVDGLLLGLDWSATDPPDTTSFVWNISYEWGSARLIAVTSTTQTFVQSGTSWPSQARAYMIRGSVLVDEQGVLALQWARGIIGAADATVRAGSWLSAHLAAA